MALGLALAACAGRGEGEPCLASSECATGLCYANLCLAPGGDEDGDGLSNAREHELHSHPLEADTDGDGKLDGDEAGATGEAADGDGDGKPDLLESDTSDADLDCIPDQLDAEDTRANTDEELLKEIACSGLGVCAGRGELLEATCRVGSGEPARCHYGKVPGYATLEPCDGLDNDCDGLTDEDSNWRGLPVGAACDGTGACGAGTVVCSHGRATCSTEPDGPEPEVGPELCNGEDDDCDGVTDEGFALEGLTVGAPCLGRGECGPGRVVCGALGQPMCSSEAGGPDARARAETCDRLDDDCDGTTDEGITLGALPLGAVCAAAGECGPGHVVCGVQGEAVCSSAPGGPDSPATVESCNGKDDNCNGATDEGLTWKGLALGAVCWGVGACGKGTVVCGVAGKPTCSSLPDAPGNPARLESCDGQDDDCDGLTDEGQHYLGAKLGQPCKGVGACGPGVVECNKSGQPTCSSNPDGSKPEHGFELCNNLDDDCDGLTDEGVPSSFGPQCPSLGVCAGHKGVPACSAGTWTCDFPGAPDFSGPVETQCDGKDNDCDGVVDEALPHTWAAATVARSDGAPSARRGAAWCSDGQALYVAGGTALDGAAQEVLVGELWRLNLVDRRWKRVAADSKLARRDGALGCLRAAPGKAASELLLLGGRRADGSPGKPTAIDPASGALSAATISGPLAPREGARAVFDVVAGRLWLIGGTGDPQDVAVQAYDAASHTWLSTAKLPAPVTGWTVADGCVDPAKGLLLLATSEGGDAHLLRAGAAKWEDLGAAPAGTGGTLVCGPGGPRRLFARSITGVLRHDAFDLSAGTWADSAAADDGWARPAAAVDPTGATVLTLPANGSLKWHRAGTWRLAAGVLSRADTAPAPAFDTTWLSAGDALYRVGGSLCPQPLPGHTCAAPRAVWQSVGGTLATASEPAAPLPTLRSPLAVADIDHGRLLAWTADHGVLVDLIAFSVAPMTTKMHASLPLLHTGARTAAHHPAARAWLYGLGPKGDAELWQLELAMAPVAKLIWSGKASTSPAPTADAELVWDDVLGRLLLLVPGKSLRVLAISPAHAKGWELIGADPTLSGGRVRLLGDPGTPGLLILLAHAPKGPPAVLRRLIPGPKATFAPNPTPPPPLWRPFDAVWRRNLGRATIWRGVGATGRLLSGLEDLLWSCD